MKRIPAAVLVLLALTACGTTVDLEGSAATDGTAVQDGTGLNTDGGATGTTGGGSAGPTGGGSSGGTTTGASLPDGTAGTSGGSSSGTAGTSGGSFSEPPGSTTQPLQVGVLITDTDSFKKATGVGESYSTLTRDAVHAYLKDINAAGGVGGRKLTPVDFTFQYAAASYDNEFSAACQTFTVDNHVGAVIYDGIVYNQNFNTCLTKAGVPSIFMDQAGSTVGDSTDFANHPGMFTVGSVTVDRRMKSILNKALARGYLRSTNKVGIFVETCPYNVRAYDRVIAPLLSRKEIPVEKVTVDCGTGASDQGTGSAAAQSAVLRFQSAGVDTVMFDTNFENGLVYFFGVQAEAQHYYPQYLLFHNQGCPACVEGWGSAKGQIVNMRGFGGLPLWDVTVPPAPASAQADVRRTCLASAKRQGLNVAGADKQAILFDSCDAVRLLREGLARSGGRAGTVAIGRGIEGLGTSFVSAMTLNGATRFGPGRHDGLELTAVSVWQTKCECIGYTGAAAPIS